VKCVRYLVGGFLAELDVYEFIQPQAVCEDRILHEAMATGGDIRRLCDLFGLTLGGAERYTRDSGPAQG
jgi:hypothetical protein